MAWTSCPPSLWVLPLPVRCAARVLTPLPPCFPAPSSLPAPGCAQPPLTTSLRLSKHSQLSGNSSFPSRLGAGGGWKASITFPHTAAGLRLTASAHSTGGQGQATRAKAAVGPTIALASIGQHGPPHQLRLSWQGRWQQMLVPRWQQRPHGPPGPPFLPNTWVPPIRPFPRGATPKTGLPG